MSKEAIKRGQLIADNIRKILLNVDLRIVYAQGEIETARADYALYARLDGVGNERRALTAKSRIECYKIYIKNIMKVKSEVTLGLDKVLERYTPKQKRIWVMYFLEKATINEIATEAGYVTRNVDKIIQQFKLDLNDFYKEAEDNGKTN